MEGLAEFVQARVSARRLTLRLLLFELVDQSQQVDKAYSCPVADADGDAQVRLAGARTADKDDVRPRLHEPALAQRSDLSPLTAEERR